MNKYIIIKIGEDQYHSMAAFEATDQEFEEAIDSLINTGYSEYPLTTNEVINWVQAELGDEEGQNHDN